jgi:hypothetical protein
LTGHRTCLRRLAGDGGQITALVVVTMAALILLAGLVLDGGLTLAARERALGEAQEAARARARPSTGNSRDPPDRPADPPVGGPSQPDRT